MSIYWHRDYTVTFKCSFPSSTVDPYQHYCISAANLLAPFPFPFRFPFPFPKPSAIPYMYIHMNNLRLFQSTPQHSEAQRSNGTYYIGERILWGKNPLRSFPRPNPPPLGSVRPKKSFLIYRIIFKILLYIR